MNRVELVEQEHQCRSCGSTLLVPVADFGHMPLANGLLNGADLGLSDKTYQLALDFCRTCSLVQLHDTVPPQEMFDEYAYFSGQSKTWTEHCRKLANEVCQLQQLGSGDLVVDIASNDGTLLKQYKHTEVNILGVDPACNVAKVAEKNGVPTLVDYFGHQTAVDIVKDYGKATVIHAHNVLGHVPALVDFASGISELLAVDGVAIVEVPYVRELVEKIECDTIYHEHVSYFSLHSLVDLLDRVGLGITYVDRVQVHGGSLRLWIEHASRNVRQPQVVELLNQERELGMLEPEYYQSVAYSYLMRCQQLKTLLTELRHHGLRVCGYGAAAKATMLLNYADIGADLVECVFDSTPAKQGKWIPGVRIPIVPPEELAKRKPDYVVVFPWNFKDEIIRKEQAWREGGGRFIVPLPELTVV